MTYRQRELNKRRTARRKLRAGHKVRIISTKIKYAYRAYRLKLLAPKGRVEASKAGEKAVA